MKPGNRENPSRRALALPSTERLAGASRDMTSAHRGRGDLVADTFDEDASEALAVLEFLSHDCVADLADAIARRLRRRVSAAELISTAGLEI